MHFLLTSRLKELIEIHVHFFQEEGKKEKKERKEGTIEEGKKNSPERTVFFLNKQKNVLDLKRLARVLWQFSLKHRSRYLEDVSLEHFAIS